MVDGGPAIGAGLWQPKAFSVSVFRRARLAGLCVLALASAPALAADFDPPYPPRADEAGDYERLPPPPPEPRPHRPRFTAGPDFVPPPEACRTFVKRRIDDFGEEVVRRVRVCDEPARFDAGFYRRPHGPVPPEDVPPRYWHGPRW